MDEPRAPEPRDSGFLIGMAAGAMIGAGLTMWLTSRQASELRRRVRASARTLSRQASDRFHEASTRMGEAVDEITRASHDVRNDVAGAVARGAHEVERMAKAAKVRA